jgi:hypothetical protein
LYRQGKRLPCAPQARLAVAADVLADSIAVAVAADEDVAGVLLPADKRVESMVRQQQWQGLAGNLAGQLGEAVYKHRALQDRYCSTYCAGDRALVPGIHADASQCKDSEHLQDHYHDASLRPNSLLAATE